MNEEIVTDLLEKEWKMFTAVKNIGGPAICQSDRKTFEIMRKSQFEAWTLELLMSYREDIDAAIASGRNLMTEKYAHMMEHTLPSRYMQIAPFLPPVTNNDRAAADRIAKKIADLQAALAKKYPLLVSTGRPIYTNEDTVYSTSLETYLKGELLTYSNRTLGLLEKELKYTDISLKTMQNTIRQYGFASLDEAEQWLVSKS